MPSFAAASAPDEPGNGQAAAALEALRTTNLPGRSYSIVGRHTDFLARLGSGVQEAGTRRDAQEALVSALQGRLDDMAGVSLDEEAASLATAQEEYVAAQRVIQVMLSLLETTLQMEQ